MLAKIDNESLFQLQLRQWRENLTSPGLDFNFDLRVLSQRRRKITPLIILKTTLQPSETFIYWLLQLLYHRLKCNFFLFMMDLWILFAYCIVAISHFHLYAGII